MLECKLCGIKVKNVNSLGKHLFYSHKETTKEKYYQEYINVIDSVCDCGKVKKFRGLGEGYGRFCSLQCANLNDDIRKKRSIAKKGKKQSKETIRKRIENTDQSKKEATRKQTMNEKYGVDNPSLVPEFAEKKRISNTGMIMPPRTKEHYDKIIESKRKNGTLNHSDSARSKITRGLNEYYQNGNDQSITLASLPSNGRGHKTGYHNNILYRSSYELSFIIFCEKNNIEIESCENKERRVRYEYEGKKRWYYPDFYLPEYDICVEIKPISMMNKLFEAKKKAAETVYNNFIVITENHLSNEETLNEYLHSINGSSKSSPIAVQ